MNRLRVALLGAVAVGALAAVLAFTPAGAPIRAWWNAGRTAPASGAGDTGAPSPAPGDSAVPSRGEVTIDPRRQQLIGVRVVPVRRGALALEVRATGIVRVDETRQTEISTRADGWIRDLRANYTGRTVSRGEPLFALYSPALIAAQNEYLLAMRGHARASGSDLSSVHEYAERVRLAARERLMRWDMTEADILELEHRGTPAETVTFRSPVAGTIVEKMAVEGMRVMAGQTLFRVTDLSVVWVEADVPEQDMARVRVGQPATVTLDAYPDQALAGRTTYIYPTVAETTRTGKVRFQFPNRGGRVRPGMFATVLLTTSEADALLVPVDALLDAGRDQLVFVALGDGRFEPRPVTVGRRTRDDVEILTGIKEGEQVATGAAFFLDSESQLRAAVDSYQSPPDVDAAAPAAAARLDITFRLQPDPPRTGENILEVTVRDASGQPVSDADVAVTFFMPAMPAMSMPAMRNQAKLPPSGGGVYRGSGQVVMAGRWDVTVDVSRGGQRLSSRQFAIVAK